MTFPGTTPAGHLSSWDQQRKLSVKNMTNETIPGFACMYLDIDRAPDTATEHIEQFYSHEAERGKGVYLVGKPNAVCEAMQNPALLIINGPTPIPPYQNGWGTQDWPAQVLAYGSYPKKTDANLAGIHLPNGAWCGPKDDCWTIGPGHAFTTQSHDATKPLATSSGHHTHLIAPNYLGQTALAESRSTAGTVEYNNPFPLYSIVFERPDFPASETTVCVFGLPGAAGGSTAGLGSFDTLEFLAGGIYWLSIAATLSSATAPEGYTLKIALATRAPGASGFSDSYLSGYRLQCVEQYDYTGHVDFYTAENVAFSGPLEVVKGEQVRLYNRATYEMSAGGVILSAFRMGAALLSNSADFQR